MKVTDEDIIVKETKTMAGDRYVYFSLEMESQLREFQRKCAWETETYDGRRLEDADYIFRRHEERLPMMASTFTWRFKLIMKKNGLPTALNVHFLRHPYVKHTTKKYNSEKQKSQTTNFALIVWDFCF